MGGPTGSSSVFAQLHSAGAGVSARQSRHRQSMVGASGGISESDRRIEDSAPNHRTEALRRRIASFATVFQLGVEHVLAQERVEGNQHAKSRNVVLATLW